jgi:hypothetical protein
MESFCTLGYLLELIIKIWRFQKIKIKSSNSGEFESFFFHQNSFSYRQTEITFFRSKFGENLPAKATLNPITRVVASKLRPITPPTLKHGLH